MITHRIHRLPFRLRVPGATSALHAAASLRPHGHLAPRTLEHALLRNGYEIPRPVEFAIARGQGVKVGVRMLPDAPALMNLRAWLAERGASCTAVETTPGAWYSARFIVRALPEGAA